MPRVLEILAAWNMMPVPASAEIPEPEVAEIVVANAFVAELDGEVVGCAAYFELGDGLCETSSFAVDPAHTARGVGMALQRARLAEMKAKGAQRVITQTDRIETIRWYVENFPYRLTGTNPKRHSFGDARVANWTVLEMDLADYVSES